ncbi:tripartite tricarboxylate transporter substrate binding protein [Verticiella sediminum]|uniref:Tripartite tricarboxylate transporter substrate binding protein n=1 Tax=Verticiella sediminum TaxID=1247510 RepID=A0A556A7Z5_9BURK|nr:tripartite tricarboxylate transporter substrate binding protein [Verticiella sediminum]TSH89008.1 tripartite tricarboxylate transporter substrate binding protein [Verticiella sediminum]
MLKRPGAGSGLIAVALSVLLAHGAACAADYPSHPVTVVVPYAPGGNLDVVTRLVTAAMGRTLGQTVLVSNRPGAGGLIGHGVVAKAAPDGYTLVTTASGSYAYSPKLQSAVPFTPDDFTAIGLIGITPQVLEVSARGRFQTFEELVEYARQKPGEVSIGHAGNGTTNHIAILQLEQALGVKFNIVPYNGSAPALNDLLGNQIDAIVDQLPSSLPHLNGGALRPLAVTSAHRAADLPDVRTLREAGVADFEVVTASGLLAPAGVPQAIVEKLNDALNQALREPAVNERLTGLGTEVQVTTPVEFGKFLQGEVAKADALASQGLLSAQ